jgi:hypothetical protein
MPGKEAIVAIPMKLPFIRYPLKEIMRRRYALGFSESVTWKPQPDIINPGLSSGQKPVNVASR